MKGHQTSVTHLLVNSKYTSILISISRDKVSLSWSVYLCPPHLQLRSLGKDTNPGVIMQLRQCWDGHRGIEATFLALLSRFAKDPQGGTLEESLCRWP